VGRAFGGVAVGKSVSTSRVCAGESGSTNGIGVADCRGISTTIGVAVATA